MSDDQDHFAARWRRVRYAAVHAPHNITIGGKPFRGGEFIPKADLANATPEQRAMIAAGGAAGGSPDTRPAPALPQPPTAQSGSATMEAPGVGAAPARARDRPEWTGHHEAAIGALDAAIGAADGLSGAQRRGYSRAARWVVARMPEGFARAFAQRVKKIVFMKDLGEVTEDCRYRGSRIPQGQVVAGFVDHGARSYDPALVLDGGFSPEDRTKQKRSNWGLSRLAEVYAHEFAHVVDDGFRLSQHWSWDRAYKAEVEGGGLSRYAAHSAIEGWAEFGRLVVTKGPEYAREHFPLCAGVWEQERLL